MLCNGRETGERSGVWGWGRPTRSAGANMLYRLPWLAVARAAHEGKPAIGAATAMDRCPWWSARAPASGPPTAMAMLWAAQAGPAKA